MSKKFSNILFVDDEETSLRIFKAAYRGKYQIETSNTVDDAWKILDSKEINLIISDQKMPKCTGIEFLSQVKEKYPKIMLILVTGFADIITLEEAINKVGIFRYVSKPWNVDSLEQIIDQALEIVSLESAKEQTEAKLKQTNERLELAIKSADLGLWDWNLETGESFLSDEYYRIQGYEPNEYVANYDRWARDVHPEDLDSTMQNFNIFLSSYQENQLWYVQVRLKKKDGGFIWARYQGKVTQVNESGVPIRMTGTMKDATQEKLQKEHEISLILTTEDKERQRIATELHDSLGQNLTATSMYLEAIKKDIMELAGDSQDSYNKGMNFLNEAINESRNIAHNLMPKAISDYGYEVSVKSLIHQLKAGAKTEIHFFCNLNGERLDPKMELGLFRITQEGINNILKYAHAEKCFIQLLKHDDILVLTIEDNGVGFDLGKINSQNSFGLTSIRNRTTSLSGICSIDSQVDGGTSITVQLPL